MPNFLFERAWPGIILWGLLYISDYAFTIICARLYKQQETIAFEGSYELTPYYQRDIDSLRVVSSRFVFILLLTLASLIFLWIMIQGFSAPQLWQFVLGALIGIQLVVHLRHFRNFVLFSAINKTEFVRGRVVYGRPLVLRASSWECFAFSAFYLILFAFTASWFILGAGFGCLSLGAKHRKLAGKLCPKPATPSPASEQTG